MRSLLLYSIAALGLHSFVHARFLTEIESKDGTLHLGLFRERGNELPNAISDDISLRKRSDNFLESPLRNMVTFYNIEVELGTPGQKFNLTIDTGSSDMWVHDVKNSPCSTAKNHQAQDSEICAESQTFDKKASSTFHSNGTDFYINYGDLSEAKGVWVTDTFVIQNHTLNNMSFGLNLKGKASNVPSGILGIGYDTNEARDKNKSPSLYANLPIRLVQDNIINTPAYSLWLNNAQAREGSLLFGGVDHAKYSGDLTKVPILKNSSEPKPNHFEIAMSSLKLKSNGNTQEVIEADSGVENPAYGVILDSGASISFLPSQVADTILQAFNASYEPNEDMFVTTCNSSGLLDFGFSGATISVDFAQILTPMTIDDQPVYFNNGEPACLITIKPSNFSFGLLGDTFLQAAYVVYDLKNHEIALAQAVFNNSDSDIEVISSTIPGATKASAYSSTTNVFISTPIATSSGGKFATVTLTRTETGATEKPSNDDSKSTATATATASASISVAAAPSLCKIPFELYCLPSITLLIGPLLSMLMFSAIVLF